MINVNCTEKTKFLSTIFVTAMMPLATSCQGSDSELNATFDFIGSISAIEIADNYQQLESDAVGKSALAKWKKKTWKDFSDEFTKSAGSVRGTAMSIGNEMVSAPGLSAAEYTKKMSALRYIADTNELTTMFKLKKSDITSDKVLEGAKMVNRALNLSEQQLAQLDFGELARMVKAQVIFLEATGVLGARNDAPNLGLSFGAGLSSALSRGMHMVTGSVSKTGGAMANNAASGVTSHPLKPTLADQAKKAGGVVMDEAKDFAQKVYKGLKKEGVTKTVEAIGTLGSGGAAIACGAAKACSGNSNGNGGNSGDGSNGGDGWAPGGGNFDLEAGW